MNSTKVYLRVMGVYWSVFGLITIFKPGLMDMFQTQAGIDAKTAFSDHVWGHDGFDILALCTLLFALSRETVSKNMLRAVAVAALMVTIAITISLTTTSYWNPMFIGSGVGCFVFVVWGLILASKRTS